MSRTWPNCGKSGRQASMCAFSYLRPLAVSPCGSYVAHGTPSGFVIRTLPTVHTVRQIALPLRNASIFWIGTELAVVSGTQVHIFSATGPETETFRAPYEIESIISLSEVICIFAKGGVALSFYSRAYRHLLDVAAPKLSEVFSLRGGEFGIVTEPNEILWFKYDSRIVPLFRFSFSGSVRAALLGPEGQWVAALEGIGYAERVSVYNILGFGDSCGRPTFQFDVAQLNGLGDARIEKVAYLRDGRLMAIVADYCGAVIAILTPQAQLQRLLRHGARPVPTGVSWRLSGAGFKVWMNPVFVRDTPARIATMAEGSSGLIATAVGATVYVWNVADDSNSSSGSGLAGPFATITCSEEIKSLYWDSKGEILAILYSDVALYSPLWDAPRLLGWKHVQAAQWLSSGLLLWDGEQFFVEPIE